MKKVVFDALGHSVEFYCESRNTRNGFAHDASLFIDNDYIGKASCYYLDRTWEHWSFQSVCLNVTDIEITYREERLKDDYRMKNGLKRISKKADREAIASIISSDETLALLMEIRAVLKSRVF